VSRAHLITLRDCLRHAVSEFGRAGLAHGHGFPDAWSEACYLVLHALHLPHDRLEVFLDARLSETERDAALSLVERRVRQRVPAAYLTREAWLADYRFYVDSRVIVPRSFIAQLLPDGLEPYVAQDPGPARILDLCTGSGCLAILAALAYPSATIVGADISRDALAVARRNVDDYGLDGRLELVRSDMFDDLPPGPFDLILSNPPYVDAPAMRALPAEFRAEPENALASGPDGLDHICTILAGAGERLTADGTLVVEAGHQRDALERAFPDIAFTWLDSPHGDGYLFLLQRPDLTPSPARLAAR